MKMVLSTIAQFVLFFVTFAVGSFRPPFKLEHVISITPDGTHAFYWDGVVLMTALLLLILLVEALRKRLGRSAHWTLLAFAFAFALAAWLHFLSFTR
jgi:hypothetical protein